MAETLGSLCDKLTIIKLKQWHSPDREQQNNLLVQEKLLQEEINEFLRLAVSGSIAGDRLKMPANKVYQKEGNSIREFHGNIAETISQLALINCNLWHQQEKVYAFEKVPVPEKDVVVKQLAILNLERNQCIDEINLKLYVFVQKSKPCRMDD